ncbi:GNAT family N-acetyltransferase [Pseudoduganella violacea]|uniref:GNAT family N-acetyltransferase n=1 Tax=Pseudoduganella violacea TaxID=1715466 RepID=UPI001C84A515
MENIYSERLILRPWAAEDVAAFVRINADPRVTEFLLGPLSQVQAEEFIAAQTVKARAPLCGMALRNWGWRRRSPLPCRRVVRWIVRCLALFTRVPDS